MTSPGRRDNGLPCADWGALVDVDPRLSEALLDKLGAAGVAAFVEPALGANTFTRAATHPVRPLDRLWVDPSRADTAREVVGAEVADLTTLLAEQEPGATAHGLVHPVPRSAARRVLPPPVLPPSVLPPPVLPLATPPAPPGGAQADPDEEFRRIVEGFGRDADAPVPPWPVVEDVEPEGRAPRGEGGLRRRRGDEPPAEEEALPSYLEPDALEDDGHYVPPPPPPVPRLAPKKALAVLAVLLGLALLFVPSLVDAFQLSPGGVLLFGFTLLLGGSAALVLLMRDAPPTDSGPDDGAVV